MISGLKPYPEYKELKLPWLPHVPKHWEIKRGRALFNCVDKRSSTGKEELLTVSSARGVVPRNSAKVTMFKAESYLGYKMCWPGDLVINSLWAWAGGLGVSRYHGIISSAYGIYRTRDKEVISPDYLHELVRSSPFNWELHVRSKGIWTSRLLLSDQDFLDAPFPLPTAAEQKAIVKFLNWANGQLERAIRAKRKTIGLLNEQKQAIIHRAVTRGLNPNAPLKPSSIPWMGEVPNHWETKRIRACLIDTRTGIWGEDPTPENRLDHVTCIRVADFDIPQLRLKTNKLTLRAVKESARSPRLLQKGDILLEKSGGGESEPVGRVVIFDLPLTAISSNFVIRLRPNPLIALPEYLLNLLAFMQYSRVNVPHIKQTTGIQNLSEKSYLSTQIAIPEPIEQAKILAHISNTLLPINKSLINIEKEIALLREYRTRLTADVVTGKLDVREAARKLPDIETAVHDTTALSEDEETESQAVED